MQLPRGTFHSMKKGMKVGFILNNLKEEGFSGSCSLASGVHVIDLVVRDGNILLASCDSACGNPAMVMIQSMVEEIADAALSDLTPAQMKLTLEFNEQCRISVKRESPQKSPVTAREENKDVQSVKSVQRENIREVPPVHRIPEKEKIVQPVSPPFELDSQTEKTPPAPSSPQTAPQPEKILSSPPESGKSKQADIFARDGDELTLVDRDLNALDSMDLATMSTKIRENCKSMIEKLHLEHLMEHQRD